MVANQAYLFIIFSITGIFITLIFDIFRIKRKVFKTSNIVTYIEDLIFWIITVIIILFMVWTFNDGEIRVYMILGLIIGMLIYLLTLSDIITKIGIILLKSLKKTISYIFSPLILICNKLYNNIKKIIEKNVKKIIKKAGLLKKK